MGRLALVARPRVSGRPMCDACRPERTPVFAPMFPRSAPLLLAMSLLSLLGCSRSSDLPATLAGLQVEITLEDITERGTDSAPYSRQSIQAVLRHARGKAIERDDVRIEVNGEPLEFRVSSGNYYDRHPYYRLRDDTRIKLMPGGEYRFALILPDGARQDLGSVRMPAALDLGQFEFARVRATMNPVTIAWRELEQPATLTLFRSDVRHDADGTKVHEAGSVHDPAALRRSIGPTWFRRGSGRWVLPADFLINTPERTLAALGAEVRIAHPGRISPQFARTSFVRAERRVTLQMDCAPTE